MTLKSNNIHYELPALTCGFTKGLLLMVESTYKKCLGEE